MFVESPCCVVLKHRVTSNYGMSFHDIIYSWKYDLCNKPLLLKKVSMQISVMS